MKPQTAHLVIMIAIFSFLSMPPAHERSIHREIASLEVEKSGYPRYEAFVSQVKPDSIVKEKAPSEEVLQSRLIDLKDELVKFRKDFKEKENDEKLVRAQRQEIEDMAFKILLLEEKEKQLEKKESGLVSHKEILESLLKDLEVSEALLVKKNEPKVTVASSRPKDEVKEDPKEEPKKEICDAEEKQKALTLQVEELMKQQQEIVKIMTMMSQSLINLQQQQMLFYTQGSAWRTSPYQFQEPMTAGNWVYYPRGFQPEQNNIFSQPNPTQAQNPIQGFYPDQIHQGVQPLPAAQNFPPSSWMLGSGDFGQSFYPQQFPFSQTYGMGQVGFNFSPAGLYF